MSVLSVTHATRQCSSQCLHASGQGNPVPEHDTQVLAPVLMMILCMQEVGW